MRSEHPIPGNPWPHDMVISVDEPNNILELLYIRSAWGIPSSVPVPPLDPEPDHGASSAPLTANLNEWSGRWDRAWARAWEWYSIAHRTQRPTPELLRALSAPGQPLHPAFPPFWRAEHGEEGIDRDALASWTMLVRSPGTMPLEMQPERVCLEALIPAWEGGLISVISLPYSGYYACRISPTHLVVSNVTRVDPDSYRRALAEPVE